MNKTYNLLEVVKVLLKWKKPIAIFVSVAAVAAVVVSLILPNYYESSSIFYPTNPSLTDRQNLFGKESSGDNQGFFGTKNDAQRMMSLAQSASVVGFVIDKFNLIEHYDIKPDDPQRYFKVKREFDSNYKVMKTELGGVLISFTDTDNQLAADLVNTVVSKINEHNNKIISDNKSTILNIFREKVAQKRKELDYLNDTLADLVNQYNIKEGYGSDGELNAVKGKSAHMVEVFKMLRKQQESTIENLNELVTLEDQYDASARESISSLYVVDIAYPAVKKVRPVRWLICVSTVLGAFLFAVLAVLLIDRIHLLREELDNAA